MSETLCDRFVSVYGPVKSWRYGTSLGLDLIGEQSACSFNCVYCQLGEIELQTSDRRIFIPTAQLLRDLQPHAPWNVDVITFSGSGEPTLAANLGEAIAAVKSLTGKPVVVLTNATLLHDADVRSQLSLADCVSLKLDAIASDGLRRVNRPVAGVSWDDIWAGMLAFRAQYSGRVDVQTMLLSPPNADVRSDYARLIAQLHPDEIQLNTPTRPKPVGHQLDGRGNHSEEDRPYEVRWLKSVPRTVLQEFAAAIQSTTHIPVRYAPSR